MLTRFNSPERLKAIIDGVFAIVVTLIVLSIEVPNLGGKVTEKILLQDLIGLWPAFFSYFLSFIILASLWGMNYRQFQWLEKINWKVFWINIAWLIFIALMPFSVSFMNQYGNFALPAMFFHFNLFVIATLSFFNWHYAHKHNLLKDLIDKKTILGFKGSLALFQITSILGAGLALLSPSWSSLVYILIPILSAPTSKFLTRKIK